jgi:DNA-binding NarL/FixJ family response regulator
MSVCGQPIRILLVDEYTLLRAGLRLLLERRSGLQVVAEAAPGPEALTAAAREAPDLILLDLAPGGERGLSLVPALRGAAPGAPVLLLIAGEDPQVYYHAVRLGVLGVVGKDRPPAELWQAVETVARGEVWLGGALIAHVLRTLTRRAPADLPTPDAGPIGSLTAREREVIALVGQGLKNGAIARNLGISEATVRHHLTSIFAKLSVPNRLALAVYAYRHGLAPALCKCRGYEAWSAITNGPDTRTA